TQIICGRRKRADPILGHGTGCTPVSSDTRRSGPVRFHMTSYFRFLFGDPRRVAQNPSRDLLPPVRLRFPAILASDSMCRNDISRLASLPCFAPDEPVPGAKRRRPHPSPSLPFVRILLSPEKRRWHPRKSLSPWACGELPRKHAKRNPGFPCSSIIKRILAVCPTIPGARLSSRQAGSTRVC